MTSKLKCPICGGEMIGNIGSPICHYNQDCPIHDRSVPQEIYDLLERTRKALDVAVYALKEYEDRDSYDCDGNWCGCEHSTAHKALTKITAPEQKEQQ